MRLAWFSNTQRNLLFEIFQLAQETLARLENSARTHLKILNHAVQYAEVNVKHLKISKIKQDIIHTVG